MKRLFMLLMCMLTLMIASLNTKAQEITITLRPGWTWIGYLGAESMDISSALGDFVPIEGDIIKSQYSTARYRDGQWKGALKRFTPGLGYHYYSMRGEPVSLVFATSSTLEGALTVTTSEPMDITATTAICGGSAISIDGTSILMKGVCWATHSYPTTDDAYTENGSGSGSFSAELTELVPNTVYYVRAYAVTVKGIIYGDELSFITNHDYVDLGLPSGLLWATCNVGADTPEAYGDYFAWGETEPKNNYNWSTYHYCNGSSSKLTKYCTNSSYGYNGFTDDLTTLLPEDDAATANWGDDWRMPTKEEWQELYDNTTCTWTTRNGVEGRLFTAANGNSIFLPAAGYRSGTSLSGSVGDYLSSTLYSNVPSRAWELSFGSDDCSMSSYGHRKLGLSVRAVRAPRKHDYVDLGLPSGALWATCNVGANTPEGYGDYFAWGETTPKSTYNWDTYQYCNGTFWYEWYDEWYDGWVGVSFPLLTKYCTDSYYGYDGFTDDQTTLLPEDDAATANWGAEWRMPTSEEWNELLNNTTTACTTQNGVYGTLFTASNGNSLFLPAAGGHDAGDWDEDLGDVIYDGGLYWSSSISTDYPSRAWDFGFLSSTFMGYNSRGSGFSVRAVHCKNSIINVTATANPEEGGSVSGGGTYLDHTICTLTAMANEGYTFVSWTDHGEVVSTNASYSFVVTGDRELIANFSLPLTITASVNLEEGGTVTGAGEYDYGIECTLIATATEDYCFVNWTRDGNVLSTQAIYSFVVTEDGDYVAHFTPRPVGILTAMYDPDPEDNQSPYVRVNWSMDASMQEDFESGDFSQHDWENNGWGISNNAYEGDYCMSSNYQGHHSSSYAQVTVFIPDDGQMSFWSRISSEGNCDYGHFYIDNQEMGAWSGNGGWEQHIYDVTAGEHTFKWSYSKDYSVDSYDDCFYVDNISFVSAAKGNRAANHYMVYRDTHPSSGSPELMADYVTDTTFVDADWSGLDEGWYRYGIKVSYSENDTSSLYLSRMVWSNRILRAYPHTIIATANPDEGGSVTGAGEYVFGTECTLTATPNENFIFINWTENGIEVSSEASYSFTVTGDRNLVANFANFIDPNTHYYVDLGLPSGLLWATCNVGACVPEAYGDYFAWGETTPKSTYNWYTYQYCNVEDIWELGGETVFLTKYCTNSDFCEYYIEADNLTTLLPEDDAATANWGVGWRMPTSEEWSELLNNTTSTWTTQNGVNGRLFTASNGNSLFLPAAGNRWDDELNDAGYYGNYWSSSLGMTYWDPEDPYNPYTAGYFNFNSVTCDMGNDARSYGFTVRPVREN